MSNTKLKNLINFISDNWDNHFIRTNLTELVFSSVVILEKVKDGRGMLQAENICKSLIAETVLHGSNAADYFRCCRLL